MFALFLSRILVYFSRSLFSVCLCRLTEKKKQTNNMSDWYIGIEAYLFRKAMEKPFLAEWNRKREN